jgi:uncharacterized protein
MKIPRIIQLSDLTKEKSAFLFGPRSTGKTFCIREQLGEGRYINLLRAQERRRFLENPSILESYVKKFDLDQAIVIDEIQLVPELLDEVHALIESTGHRFLLTGSSARKLKKVEANMLGGRARRAEFFPLTWKELNDAGKFDLDRYLLYGGIPDVYLSEHPEESLSDYTDTYLNLEIKAESATRNVIGFENFLSKISLSSGDTIVLQNLANDAQVSPPTIRNYMEILEDTLIGYHLKPWRGSKRKAIQSAKFYLFDLGVKWFLAGVDVLPSQSDLYGQAFEHFIVGEVRACHSYNRTRQSLYFWRTTHQDEVDLIIGDQLAIEIKSKSKTTLRDAKNLKKLKEEDFQGDLILVSKDELNREEDGVRFLHWKTFFDEMWSETLEKNNGRLL